MKPGDLSGIRDKRKQLMIVQMAGDDLLPWPGPWTVRSVVVEYVIDEIPKAVLVWYFILDKVSSRRLHALAGIPSRWASKEGNNITMRS